MNITISCFKLLTEFCGEVNADTYIFFPNTSILMPVEKKIFLTEMLDS